VLRDIIGIARPLVNSKAFIIFCKIGYLKIQKMINDCGHQFISSEDFILCLLDFYEVMCNCSMDNLISNSQTIYYSILVDCFKLMTTLVNECNGALRSIQKDIPRMKQFFSDKYKMLSKFIGIFHGVASTKNLNFGMFHFFGEMNYVQFLSGFMQYIFLLAPILPTYPDQEQVVFKIICLMTETNLEIMLSYYEPEMLSDLVNYLSSKFQQVCQSSQNDSNENSLDTDNVDLTKIKESLSNIYTFISNEIQINDQNLHDKAIKVRESILTRCLDFPNYILEAAFSLNYSISVCNHFASMIFYFYSFDENNSHILPSMRHFLQRQYATSDPTGEKNQVIENFIVSVSQQNKSLNQISSFQSFFSQNALDLIQSLVKSKR